MPITEKNGISRKDFLKFLGAGAIVITLGGIAGFMPSRKNSALSNSNNGPDQQAYAQTSGGSWSLGGNTLATPVHVAMLYNGKILCVAGSGYYSPNILGPFQVGIFDPITNTYTALPNQSADMFCCGNAMLANGNILLAGGTLAYDDHSLNGLWLGEKKAWIYDVAAGSVRTVQSMRHGRWYPTLLTLADGKVVAVNGYDEYGSSNKLIEVFDPTTETWSIKYDPLSTANYCAGEGQDPNLMPGAGTVCYGPGVGPNALLYPRMHLMPEGLVIVCGQSKTMRTFDPATGVWKFAGNMLFNASRGYGSSVLLPMQNVSTEKGKVLIFGGTAASDTFATNTAEILTLSGTTIVPRWTNPSMKARRHPIPVIMPTGKIMVIGGTEFQNDSSMKVMEAELFDPVAETWTLLPAMTVPRLYHSSGLLLPDGRVWTAGTTYTQDTRELRTEIYTPDYYSVPRPTISGSPVAGDYGGSIVIPTPNGLQIDAVSLVRIGSETHAYNTDQRLIWLQITDSTASNVTVNAPVNANIAPPGYYMIHVLDGGIPSKAKIIKIPGGVPSDIIPPNISISSPANGSTFSGPSSGVAISVAGTASDGESGVQKVEVKIGSNGSFQLAAPSAPGVWSTWSYNGTATVDGSQPITARATDIAGNTRDSTVNVNVVFSSGFVKIYSVVPTSSYGDLSSTISSKVGEIVGSGSSLIGANIKQVSIIAKKAGAPTGTVSVVVRKGSDNSVALTFGSINTTSLSTSDQTFTLTAPSSYALQANDKVLVEWGGTGSSADKVLVKRKGDSDGFGGSSTCFVAYLSSYTTNATRDLAGDWYKETGGPPPPPPTSQKLSVLAVRASGDDGHVPQNTLDGNLDTRWSDFGTPSWIEYDVAMSDVNEVKLAFHHGNKRTHIFRVETTDGVSPLSLAGTFQNARNSLLQSFKFAAKNANRVRVTITSVSGSLWCSVTEAQIWGIP